MLLKRFYLNLIIRLVLILINMVLQAFAIHSLFEGQLLFTFIVLTGILILQVVFLFLYVKKSNRQLTKLVLSLSNQDLMQKLGDSNTPHKEFKQALNAMVEQYKSVYMEKESQSFMIHQLVMIIPVGILVLDHNGSLILKNQAIGNILNLSNVNTLEEISIHQPALYEHILEPGIPGVYNYPFTFSGEQKKLAITIKQFPLLNKQHKIFLIQDISKEVDAGEIDAIQRLLRILTHEIMNSLTPVQSLTETITMLMSGNDGKPKPQDQLSQENYNDILESVLAIQDRTSGLDHFVTRFRALTRMPEKLEREKVLVKDLFESVCTIMKSDLEEVKIKLEVENEDLSIQADSSLMEQVLINLLTNALTATAEEDQAKLGLKAFSSDTDIIVQLSDNGTGIPEKRLADIFLPFYSTKEQASGIGLSFVKQILHLHNASIQVKSFMDKGSTFTMSFRKPDSNSNSSIKVGYDATTKQKKSNDFI